VSYLSEHGSFGIPSPVGAAQRAQKDEQCMATTCWRLSRRVRVINATHLNTFHQDSADKRSIMPFNELAMTSCFMGTSCSPAYFA